MTATRQVRRKLRKALKRGAFRTADLFAGCGGFSLGFQRAGFRNVLAIEADEDAFTSHVLNFSQLSQPDAYRAFNDIRDVPPARAVKHLCSARVRTQDAIDILIGGPPCQAFSLLGRAALWGLARRKHAHAEDPRANLYEYFLEYVRALRPIAFVMENVREIGKFNDGNLAEDIASISARLGYNTRYALLNAAYYGVPQYRERMFIIGIHDGLDLIPGFPPATHQCVPPRGYASSRVGMGKALPIRAPHESYVDFLPFGGRLSRKRFAVTPTALEALADLPRLTYHLNGAGQRDASDMQGYNRRVTNFGTLMRSWPDFASGYKTDGHVVRLTPRDYRLFRQMKPGDMYPQAAQIAEANYLRRLHATESRLHKRLDSRSRGVLRAEMVPPYDVDKYPNKYRKMSGDEPAHTVPAHLGKDCYSHIHFDSAQARTISVREAARLQSFPDGFILCGGMNARFTQIGNAVPPLLAYAVARHLLRQLRSVLA